MGWRGGELGGWLRGGRAGSLPASHPRPLPPPPSAAGFRLPDDYHNPSLGKVVRPGSSVAVDLEDLGLADSSGGDGMETDPYEEMEEGEVE